MVDPDIPETVPVHFPTGDGLAQPTSETPNVATTAITEQKRIDGSISIPPDFSNLNIPEPTVVASKILQITHHF